jgi:hypothetical protein
MVVHGSRVVQLASQKVSAKRSRKRNPIEVECASQIVLTKVGVRARV